MTDTLEAEVSARDDEMIQAAADQAGAPFEAAKRVYDLMNDVDKASLGELGLKVVDGKVTVDWQNGLVPGPGDEIKLPQSLWDKIDDLDFDIIEVLEPIQRAWQERFGHPYPTVMRFSHHPDDPTGTLRLVTENV